MATTTTTTAPATAPSGGALQIDSIPVVDLRLFSHSELYALSLCSSSAFDPDRCDDVVIPKIDRSVFNESAGSRKQTYSQNAESAQMVNLFKKLFVSDVNLGELLPVEIDYSNSVLPQQSSMPSDLAADESLSGHKRKHDHVDQDEPLANQTQSAMGVSVPDVNNDVDGISSLNETVVREKRKHDHVGQDEPLAKQTQSAMGISVPDVNNDVDGISSLNEIVVCDKQTHDHVGQDEPLAKQTQSAMGVSVPDVNNDVDGISSLNEIVEKRKHDHVGQDEPLAKQTQPAMGVSVADVNNDVDGIPSLNGIVVRDNLEDKDREILNREGVSVDIVALGVVDHPYSEEIRRRTEGLETEEELLGFLKGLKGQWGSSRKKRRIVDASEFGSVLPIGWKLLLSVKKQKGHMWLHCRRYISPSGQQFVSCKEASLHLITRNGVQDTHPSTPAQHNEIANDRLTSITIADIATKDVDREENLFPHTSPPAFASTSGNHETQVISDAGFLPEERLGEILHCNTCNVTFCEKDEILHYQSSVHRNNGYKNVVRVTDGVMNESKSFHEASNYAYVNGCTSEIIADDSSSQERPGNCSPLPSHDETQGAISSVIENSSSAEKPQKNMASESSLSNSNNHAEACDIVVNNDHICQTRNEPKVGQSSVVKETILELFGSCGTQDKDIAVSVKQPSNLEDIPCKIIDTTDKKSTFASMAKQNLQSNISTLASSCDEKACAEDSVPCSVDEYIFGEKQSSKSDDISLCMNDEMHFGIGSFIPSSNKKESMPGKNDSKGSTCLLKEPGVQSTSKTSFVDFEGIKIDPFSSHTALNFNTMTGTEQDWKVGVFSADKQFFKENEIQVFGRPLEEPKQESSKSVLLSESGVSEVSGDSYTMNKYGTPAKLKISEVARTGKHGLSLSSGNLQKESRADSNRVEQERYLSESFNIQSDFHRMYGDQTHLSFINNQMKDNLKQERHFGIDFRDSSFNNTTNELGSNFNMLHQGMGSNGPRGDSIPSSSQNFMVGFGDSNAQSGDFIVADSSWRTGHENLFQGCFDAVPNPQVQSSSCFRTFDLTSDKAEEGSFGVSKNAGIRTNTLRPGRNEPVEYSFMGEQSSNSLPGGSKMFSHNANTEQGLDPSFWLGNDALMPNTADTNQSTSVCVWCRSLFYQEHVQPQPGIQTGAIGSLCPSCSKFSVM
ncbi:hypothetical protein DH2020_035524 [Rehmannia glutinosa]|uniref:Methyl-CpG-binding domain-containing protein n=1 Tax=Rehmannia glutinosa TaxID=99300 RepID=A0ABR0V9E9_REHGL